eukprot:SAG31_NODE_22800_length_517_cov_1.299043_1_plen_72_part_01
MAPASDNLAPRTPALNLVRKATRSERQRSTSVIAWCTIARRLVGQYIRFPSSIGRAAAWIEHGAFGRLGSGG